MEEEQKNTKKGIQGNIEKFRERIKLQKERSEQILKAAQKYVTDGCSVIPIRKGYKKPTIKWKQYQDSLPTEKDLNEWYAYGTGNQIAMVFGCVSGGRFCIDFDGPRWEEAYVAFLNRFPQFIEARTVSTGSGKAHIHGRCPEMPKDLSKEVRVFKEESKEEDETKIELLCNGHYAVVPPSIHPSGKYYSWVKEQDVTLTLDEFNELVRWFREGPKSAKPKPEENNDEEEDSEDHWDTIDPEIQAAKEQSIVEVAEKLGLDLDGTYHGNCPTGHPSVGEKCFSLNVEENYWHCFHCEKGGDTIALVRSVKGCGFREAVDWLLKPDDEPNEPEQPQQETSTAEEQPQEENDSSDSDNPDDDHTDTTQFSPMTVDQLTAILETTIIKDNANKVLTFLCALAAFTEESQFNISFNSPSSTGKSYIPKEIAVYFPKEDLLMLGYCSPKAFFHDIGVWDKERKVIVVDLAHKIIIFLDQPHQELLVRLRPLLSHDEKEITSKITDKKEKHGTKTKTVIIRGFPSVIFCSAGLMIDEQEGTRFILLSPESDQEKLKESIALSISRESNAEEFKANLEANPERIKLKARIRAIKAEHIANIVLSEDQQLRIAEFFSGYEYVKPKHQRDSKRIISVIKALALLNVWFRKREGSTLYVAMEDVEEGIKLWQQIVEPQEYNLSPFVYDDIYKKVLVPLWEEKDRGVYIREILTKYQKVHKRPLSDKKLEKEILPALQMAGLVIRDKDPDDKRKLMILRP